MIFLAVEPVISRHRKLMPPVPAIVIPAIILFLTSTVSKVPVPYPITEKVVLDGVLV